MSAATVGKTSIFTVFGAGIAAVGVTIGLFIIMYTLIATSDVKLEEDDLPKIADIMMEDTTIDDNLKEFTAEKPEDPEAPPPELATPEIADIDVDTSLNVSFAPSADVKIGIGGGLASDGEYLPIVKVAPIYPRRAQTRGIEGYCIVEYVVTKNGSIRDPKPVDCKPAGMFESSSVKASLKFKYKPRVQDGEPIEVAGVRNKFTYALEK